MIPEALTVEELVDLLGAEDVSQRVKALVWAETQGASSAASLVSVVRHERADVRAKVWAMMAIARLGPSVIEVVRSLLIASLADDSPTVRRAAIQALSALEDVSAREAIAHLLTDDTLDPSAWFDDDCTVSQAARVALQNLDSVKARLP